MPFEEAGLSPLRAPLEAVDEEDAEHGRRALSLGYLHRMSRPERRQLLSALLSAALLLGAVALIRRGTPPAASGTSFRWVATGAGDGVAPPELRGEIRWMGIAGGAEPESTQVSIEQDLRLAMDVLGDEGLLLFAGGPDVAAVQENIESRERTSLRAELGDFFDPRGGRSARYRRPRPRVHAAASAANALTGLESLLGRDAEPLLVFVDGHGEPGEAPADNLVRLWGAWPLAVRDLAELLDAGGGRREVRVVMASCFSGGFAELAFLGAETSRGPALTPRCGLFASPWDDESSGCVPDPDRSTQDGYAMHLLNALAGRDAQGEALPIADLDLDGDGAISLLEAHTRARVASRSIDIPTTTSERWLRHVMADARDAEGAPRRSFELPEELRVIAALGPSLAIGDVDTGALHVATLEQRMEDVAAGQEEAERDLDEAFYGLRIALLERWPGLEDPWRSDFEATLRGDADRIDEIFRRSELARVYRIREEEAERFAHRYDDLRRQRALAMRVLRALETVDLAMLLAERGGADFAHYRRLLECERGLP